MVSIGKLMPKLQLVFDQETLKKIKNITANDNNVTENNLALAS